MGNPNEVLLQKALESSDFFAGGQINPTQQAEFVRLVKEFAVMLAAVRFIDMPTKRYQIDKIHLGEPITRGIGENTDASSNPIGPKFNQVELITSKVKTFYYITTEAMQVNIEFEDIESTVLEMVTKRIATDMELLAIQGDTSIVGTTPLQELLKVLDGWGLLTEGAHVLDAGANTVNKGLFAEMIRTMPEQYLQDPDLRWMMSRVANIDWLDYIGDRETAMGDEALRGNSNMPLGIPALVVPLIPSNLPVSVATATPARHVGVEFGPFEIITGTNDTLSITVGANTATVTLPQGMLEPVRVAREINLALAAAAPGPITNVVASDNGLGQVQLITTDTGAGATFTINAGNANTTIGFTAAVYTGSAAGSGTVNEGTFIWLGNPMNWIWGMLDATRVYSEFEKDYDRIEVVIYNEVAAAIENLDGIVKGKNIRRRPL